MIYAIAFDQGQPLLGTGNKGIVYRVDSPTISTQLLNAPPSQVTGFLAGHNGVLYAADRKCGEALCDWAGKEKTGTLESEALDAGSFADWGKVHLLVDLHGGAADVRTRSGNVSRPQKNWSDWSAVDLAPKGGAVESPAARFLQYRLTLSRAATGVSPELTAVQIAYVPKNIAPTVRAIEVADANYRLGSTANLLERNTAPSGSSLTLSLPPVGKRKSGSSSMTIESSAGVTLQYAKGYVTVRWDAADENGDALSYSVEIQGKGETVGGCSGTKFRKSSSASMALPLRMASTRSASQQAMSRQTRRVRHSLLRW